MGALKWGSWINFSAFTSFSRWHQPSGGGFKEDSGPEPLLWTFLHWEGLGPRGESESQSSQQQVTSGLPVVISFGAPPITGQADLDPDLLLSLLNHLMAIGLQGISLPARVNSS